MNEILMAGQIARLGEHCRRKVAERIMHVSAYESLLHCEVDLRSCPPSSCDCNLFTEV